LRVKKPGSPANEVLVPGRGLRQGLLDGRHAAFVEACRSVAVPVAIERSRSGNGAHAWFFFSAPVAASAARKMGCCLITEAMAHRHQLGMGSCDRLFPSQDTTPRGGFGNLIALPLQYEPRRNGNTVFVDDRFEP
jgi:hypothetical protein